MERLVRSRVSHDFRLIRIKLCPGRMRGCDELLPQCSAIFWDSAAMPKGASGLFRPLSTYGQWPKTENAAVTNAKIHHTL